MRNVGHFLLHVDKVTEGEIPAREQNLIINSVANQNSDIIKPILMDFLNFLYRIRVPNFLIYIRVECGIIF